MKLTNITTQESELFCCLSSFCAQHKAWRWLCAASALICLQEIPFAGCRYLSTWKTSWKLPNRDTVIHHRKQTFDLLMSELEFIITSLCLFYRRAHYITLCQQHADGTCQSLDTYRQKWKSGYVTFMSEDSSCNSVTSPGWKKQLNRSTYSD